jgi:archaellum component FlaC
LTTRLFLLLLSNTTWGFMEEKILQSILEEIKGLRNDTNNRFASLENKVTGTNQRLDSLENRFEGLKSSVEVLQIGVNQVCQELIGIKEVLGNKVIR